jgi:hypothetical protein
MGVGRWRERLLLRGRVKVEVEQFYLPSSEAGK